MRHLLRTRLYPHIRAAGRSHVVRMGGAYTFINLAAALIPLLMIPVLTRLLPPAEMGHWAMFSATLSLLIPLMALGLVQSVGRHFFELPQQQNAIHIGSTLLFTGAVCLGLALLATPFNHTVAPLLHLPPAWVTLLPLLAFLQIFTTLLFVVTQCLQRPNLYAIFRLGQAILLYGAALAALLAGGADWQVLSWSQLAAALAVTVAGLAWMSRNNLINLTLDKPRLTGSLKFGIPLVLQDLAMITMLFADRTILAQFTSLTEVGFYMVAFQLAQGMLLVAVSAQQAWGPWFYKRSHAPETSGTPWWKLLAAAMGLLCILSVLYAAAIPVLSHILLPPAYATHSATTALLSLGFGLYGMMSLGAVVQMQAHRTPVIAAIMAATCVANVVLNYLLIPHYRLIGAGAASVAGFGLGLVLTIADITFAATRGKLKAR